MIKILGRQISFSNATILISVFILIYITSNLNWGGDKWKGVISADAKGYYAYLPATFIYHDLNYGFFDKIEKEKYYNKYFYFDYRLIYEGKRINKFYCGTAVAQTPFFLIAHFLSYIFNYDLDGYSKLYMMFICLAAVFYTFLGLVFLNKSMDLFGVNEIYKSLVLSVVVFGTNLFFYVVVEAGYSHIYSFAFVSMFLYHSLIFFRNPNKRSISVLAILIGFIILIRPVNALIIFIWPFAAGNNQQLRGFSFIFKNFFHSISSLVLALLIISIQLTYYKLGSDYYFVYTYLEEYFYFSKPNIFKMLFSYKKGLFVYTPIYLLSIVSFLFLFKKYKFRNLSFLLFFLLITYVLSSWWMWFYGGSFSSRVYVEYLSIFMLIFGLALSKIENKKLKKSIIAISILLTIICQIQIYQYRYGLIHYSDMTKEKYWDVFLRIDKI